MMRLQRHICGGARIKPPDSELCDEDAEPVPPPLVVVVVAVVAEVAPNVVVVEGVGVAVVFVFSIFVVVEVDGSVAVEAVLVVADGVVEAVVVVPDWLLVVKGDVVVLVPLVGSTGVTLAASAAGLGTSLELVVMVTLDADEVLEVVLLLPVVVAEDDVDATRAACFLAKSALFEEVLAVGVLPLCANPSLYFSRCSILSVKYKVRIGK